MATKDWKKTTQGLTAQWFAEWINKRNSDFISIRKNPHPKDKNQIYTVFTITRTPEGYISKETSDFKTKSQALKFARNYMKKH